MLYCAWVRAENINVMMRLRDWKPNREVIAPVSLRPRIAEENQELRRKRTEYEQPDFLIPLTPQADGESTLDEIE